MASSKTSELSFYSFSHSFFFVLDYCHAKYVSNDSFPPPFFFLLGSNAAVNMEISESVGKMRIVPFYYGSIIMYYCSAFAESLQTK